MGYGTYPKDSDRPSGLGTTCVHCGEPMKADDKCYLVGKIGGGKVAHATCEWKAAVQSKEA